MNQRNTDKVLILSNSYGEGPDAMIEALGSKRNMTLFEERVLRCVHHEFGCLTQEEAAAKLNVSPSTISRTLNELEERAKTCKPIQIMFPILTKPQFEVYKCVVGQGLSISDTAEATGLTESTVNKMMTTMRAKGETIPKRSDLPKTKSYVPSMDKQVKHKF